MTRRLSIFAATLGLLAAACAAPFTPGIDYGNGQRFVPTVADTLDDVGRGASVAVAADGSALLSYFGFPGKVAEGKIPIPRPIGSAFLPAVLLTSVTADGLVTKGAVQQTEPAVAPPGIKVPFRPDTVKDLPLTPDDANGSSVAVAGDGSVHIAWTQGQFVYYAKAAPNADAVVSVVFDYGTPLAQAGPIGRPAIALDASGAPWIAFGLSREGSFHEVVATPAGTDWTLTDVAKTPRCNGCPQPLPSGIAVVGGGPMVVFGDPATGDVIAATDDGKRWTTATVESGGVGAGLSFASGGDTAGAAYYAGAAVHVATWSGSSWSTAQVAEAAAPAATSGLDAASTGVALGPDGTTWVAWEDAGVHLASGDGSTFTSVDTPGTEGGADPSVAVGSDGTVFVAWFDTDHADLMLGYYGDLTGLALANPSPAPTVSLAPTADTSCGVDKKVVLDLVAKGLAWNPTCLVAAAGKPFTINVDNQDAAIPHNLDVLTAAGGDSLGKTEQLPGPVQQTLDLGPLDAGSYYFQCDVHPTMIGTLAVVAGAK